MKTKFKLPPRGELAALVRSVLCADFRAFEGDETPGICLTVGASLSGKWSFQTGDNSFTGGAYGFHSWGVAGVYRDSNSFDVADTILDELAEGLSNEAEYADEQKARASRVPSCEVGPFANPSI